MDLGPVRFPSKIALMYMQLTPRSPINGSSTSSFSIKDSTVPATVKSSCPMEHDIFISFRGKDVRLNFLSVLSNELRGREFDVYADDRLERGVDILPTLFREIERSRILLVIFSQDYASSTWCLEELAKMVECKGKNNQILIPVFYEVSPSDVRKQNGDYGSALAKHAKKYPKNKVQIWRSALEKAANASGFHYPSYEIESEAKLVEKIVECVFKRLKNMVQPNPEAILTIGTSDTKILKPNTQHSNSQIRRRVSLTLLFLILFILFIFICIT